MLDDQLRPAADLRLPFRPRSRWLLAPRWRRAMHLAVLGFTYHGLAMAGMPTHECPLLDDDRDPALDVDDHDDEQEAKR